MEKEILDVLQKVISWQSRFVKLPKSTALPSDWEPNNMDLGGRYYSYVINHWIVVQPDSKALMKLFILCGFDLIRFVRLIIGTDGGTRMQRAA
jgi:hypothetical protein